MNTTTPLMAWLHSPIFQRRARSKDLSLFSQQIAVMIKAGVPILQSLTALSRQTQKESLRKVIHHVTRDIEGGDSLSIALAKHPAIFSPFFIAVVRTGEASGRLAESLAFLADHLEQNYLFVRKIQAALAYPALILVAVIIVIILMMTFVLPQLIGLFVDANVALPLATRIVLAITLFWRDYWYIVIALALGLGLVARSYLRTPEGRYTASTYILRFPVLQSLFQKIYLARLTSLLFTLFSSDVPVIESLTLAEKAMGNRVYQRILQDTVRAIKDGATISSVWQYEPFIPPMLTAMISVGEKTGKIEEAFSQSNRFFKRDVEAALNTITVLLEPLMVVVLGIGVAFVVAAVLLPIYNLVLIF